MEIILIRHGESTANTAGVLAGRSDDVALTERGREQVAEARALVPELREPSVPVLTSPIARCVSTARILADDDGRAVVLEALAEVDYGDWTGRSIADLLREELWRTVRSVPSRARFPGGESLSEVYVRARLALAAARVRAEEAGAGAVVLVSHGDVIKLALAHALGVELDQFQRIAVAPASVSRILLAPAPRDGGEAVHGPPMTVTMLGATAAGRTAQGSVPGGGR
ncbi:histidine phosphatase family protein [Brevibacterium album]|uniref:histidine phosphatase family protein n=1 Tax=Brevibacterium album TaxID=417948 RepID=UPI0004221B98|nr:histidine phosphatase family protein [Brevibacterium album]